jgi:hypothetical protein
VGEYAPDQLAQFKNAFRPTADSYRRHLRIVGVAVWVVFFFIGFAGLLATAAPHWLSFSLVFAGFFLLGIVALWAIVLTRSLKCPACKRQIITFCACCPECGHSPLAIGWFGGRSCEHCGKTLCAGKRRNYKIKVCSHCGVGFLLNGNMCVGIWKNSLIVRIGPESYEDALKDEYVREFDITGRPMKGWTLVEPDGIETDEQLSKWIEQSLEFVTMLPKK